MRARAILSLNRVPIRTSRDEKTVFTDKTAADAIVRIRAKMQVWISYYAIQSPPSISHSVQGPTEKDDPSIQMYARATQI